MVKSSRSNAWKYEHLMTAQRPLSRFETSYFGSATRLGSVPIGGMPLFIGTTVEGRLDLDILARVLDDLAAAHALLRAEVITDTEGAQHFRLRENYRVPLTVRHGGAAEYLELVNSRPDWTGGLFRAEVLRDGDRHQIVLIIHHGVSDGRSAFALLGQLWQRYTGYISGAELPAVLPNTELFDGIDRLLTSVISPADARELLDQWRAGAMTMGPDSVPRQLPRDGSGADPLGQLALHRIELNAVETTSFVAAARAQGISVNSLLSGVAMAAIRARLEPADGPLLLLCGHAADVRGELPDPLPAEAMLNCASGLGTPVLVTPADDPAELGQDIAAQMAAAAQRHEAARFMVAAQQELDEVTAALLASPPTLAISNIGRLPAHSLPEELRVVRNDVFAVTPGMPPKLTVFTVGDRLTIQVEHDTAQYSRAQMEKLTQTLIEQLQAVRA